MNIGYIIFIVICLIVMTIQQIYIQRLRKGILYAVEVLQKYETALKMEGIIGKVKRNESKTD